MSNERVWLKFDVGFFEDFAVIGLRERYGPAGPLAFVALMVAAKTTGWVHGEGNVVFSYSTLAAEIGIDAATAKSVVSGLSELGLIEVTELNDLGFHAAILRWTDHQSATRPRSGAERVRDHRARETPANTDPPSPELVTHVTEDVTNVTACNARSEKGEGRKACSNEQAKRASTIDQDALPVTLDSSLSGTASQVLPRLIAVWEQRGGNKPTLRGIGLALSAFPDRDHLAVLGDLEHWALAGNGATRPQKDWVRLWRSFLGRAPVGSPTRLRAVSGSPQLTHSRDFSRFDQKGAA